MNQPGEALALAISHAAAITTRYVEDLNGDEWLRRPHAEANCAAWAVGHLVLTARHMMTRAGAPADDLPALPDGFDKRFARDEAAPKAADYGDTSVLLPLFKEHHERLAAVARNASPERLDTSLNSNHPFFRTVGTMLAFAPVHIATHAGQIIIIRRVLGRPIIA